MFYVIINVLLYASLLLFYKKKGQGFDTYQIIVMLYLFTAVMCTLNYAESASKWPDLGLIPFIYMFVVLVIMFRPVQHFNLERKVTPWEDTGSLYALGFVYIILAILDTYFSMNDTIARFSEGDWGALRNQLYADADEIILYENQWQRLIKNLLTYLRPFAVVYAFFRATLGEKRLYTFLLFLSIIVPSFIGATVVASRGMVFGLAMELILVFWIFRHRIPKALKRGMLTAGLAVGVFFVFYSLLVTVSRFGEDEASGSVFEYFGHSMLYFNDGIFNDLHDIAYGKRFFSWFIDLFGGNSDFDMAKAGATHGTAFYTIVGSMYLDWGFVGTLVTAILACLLVQHFTQKRTIMLSDMVIIIFYINTLAKGIFAFGRGRALEWIMTFVVFFIVKALEKQRRKAIT